MKKLFAILLVIMLFLPIFSTVPVFAEETGIDTSKYIPKLGLSGDTPMPVATAGWTTTLNLPIKNYSDNPAWNIEVSLDIEDKTKYPAIFDKLRLSQSIKNIASEGTANIVFEFKVSPSAPEGVFPLKISYVFENAYGDEYTSSEVMYIKIVNNNSIPRLTVDSIELSPESIMPGTDTELKINIKNLGSFAAKDIRLTLSGLKNDGLTIKGSTDVRYMQSVNAQGRIQVTYVLTSSKNITGNQELTVKMEYRDEANNSYSEVNQIYIPSGDAVSGIPELSFEKMQYPQTALSVNKDFTVSMDIKNSGTSFAKNIKVSVASDKELVAKTLSSVIVDKLEKDNSKSIEFKMFATQDAITKNYPIAVNIEYEDSYGVKHTASQYIGVYIENSSGKTVPKIIVDKYTIDPSSVKAGEDFNLKMSFLNTSKSANVSNIKVTVASEDGTFTPTDSGNTFYIDGIASKKNVEREILLHTKPDAEQKSYVLAINFEYEDDMGNPYTSKETISVRVLQNPRLVTGEMSLPPETFAGQPLSIYIDFYNMGKSTLFNMMVKAEGEFDGQNLSYYVGNFEPGRTDSFDVSIIPKAPGDLKGNIVFSFEDANGKITEIRKEFAIKVMEMMQQGPMLDENGMPIDKGMGMPGNMPGGPVKKTSILVYVIPAIVVIAAIVTFILLRKRHVRRKEMSLDE